MQVTGFGKDWGYISKLEIDKAVNSHSVCEFDFVVTGDEQISLGQDVSIEDDDHIYMRGYIDRIVRKRSFHETRLHVVVLSYSKHSDIEPYKRIFQSIDKTYSKIGEKLKNEGLDLFWPESLKNEKVETVILQQNETDFAFLVRLAEENGFFFYLTDTEEKKAIVNFECCDEQMNEVTEVDDSNVVTEEIEFTDYEVICKARLNCYNEMGDCCRLFNENYKVVRLRIVYKNDLTKYYYTMFRVIKPKNNLQYSRNANMFFPVGKACVVDNKDPEDLGRLQVAFLEMEDCLTSTEADKKYTWLPYLSPLTEKGGGMLWIPDPGEVVEVIWLNNRCVAIGCNREVQIQDDCQNIQNRICQLRDKQITIAADRIEILAFDKTEHIAIKKNDIQVDNPEFFIKMTDQGVVVKAKHNKTQLYLDKEIIQLIAEKQLEKMVNNTCAVYENDSINLQCKGTNIQMTGNHLQLESGSSLEIKKGSIDAVTGCFNVN